MEKIKIGKNAGIIWRALEQVKEISLPELCHITSLPEKDVLLAIGWLAREDKIFIEKRNETLTLSHEKSSIEFSFG